MNLGNKVKRRRQELGLTLKDVATSIGVAESTVSRWETGEIRDIGIANVTALSSVLRCSTEYLLDSTCGERIQIARKRVGLSQTELAKSVNISKQTLHKYENSIITNIPHAKVKDIAEKLGIKPAFLMGWEDIVEQENTLSLNIRERLIGAISVMDNEHAQLVWEFILNHCASDITETQTTKDKQYYFVVRNRATITSDYILNNIHCEAICKPFATFAEAADYAHKFLDDACHGIYYRIDDNTFLCVNAV